MGDLGVELYYMRNRWYEPRTGRFLSEDPIGLAGGINPYGFAGADPVNKADPTGLAYRCRGDGTAYLLVTDGQVWGTWISWGSWGCHNYETGDDSNEGVGDIRGGGRGVGLAIDPCRLNTPYGHVIVDESIAGRVIAFLGDLWTSGFRGVVTDHVRSWSDQAVLWANRGSNRNLVGRSRSAHLAGFALDFNWYTMGRGNQAILERVAARHGFIWGANTEMDDSVRFFAGTCGPYGNQATAIVHNQSAGARGVGVCSTGGA
jgi:hypothetical protein